MKKFKDYKSNKNKILINGNVEDKINGFINELSLLICIIFAFFYYNNGFISIREVISDTISLSSIILGILGVLLGLLISLQEDSSFFKKAKEINKDRFYFKELIIQLRDSFILNIVFVIYTLFFNLLPPSQAVFLKLFFISFWIFLFIKIIWRVIFLIIIISKISLYTPSSNPSRDKVK